MGFRDYEAFNQALLAKQAWRLLTVPTSLCARVLKARYFSNSDFLHSRCPKRGSFTWRSILFGRDLLTCGLIRRIGDDSQVEVWVSNWIPRDSVQRPLGCKPDSNVRRVCELLTEDGSEWNEDKLQEVFYE
jgi:hypothetical protein